jgi:hypothetical protein
MAKLSSGWNTLAMNSTVVEIRAVLDQPNGERKLNMASSRAA